MDKTLGQLIKGTILGEDGQGSAKRATAFYFTTILLTSMIAVEEYCYYLATISLTPTPAQLIIVKAYEPSKYSILLTLWIFFGFTSFDKLVDAAKLVIQWIKGVKVEDKKTE